MVYESDFYTTRRPYRATPSVSSYTISGVPSRQVRVLPGLGKVHVTYTYDRIVPYVGHKRLTVVTAPPRVWGTRPSVLQREFDRIENKIRPWTGYSATNRYLNSNSAVRTYYVNYPITGSDYYDYYYSLNSPSTYYSPRLYRWYSSWPREYRTYWPMYRTYLSRYLRNYYQNLDWPSYYWSTYLPYTKNLDYEFSDIENKIDNLRKTIYLDYPYPIKAVDYTYYPQSYKSYTPLSLYYDYYWPLSSLNRYSSYWPYYPYHRYLYHKYTLPSDRYYHLKGVSILVPCEIQKKMIFLRDPIRHITDYRIYPTTPKYLRHKVYKPLSLYCDYYDPIRSLFWDSSYWPLYKTTESFIDQCNQGTGDRLQRIFDDETRLIRAQTASLLKRIHDPVPRVQRYSWPAVAAKYDNGLPARLHNDNYIHRLLVTSPNSKTEYTTYYTEPVKKYIGAGHLAAVSYAGDRVYSRRPHIYLYEDPLKNDIQLLSYYINKFKQEKAITASSEPAKVPLNPARATRKFTAKRLEDDEEAAKEMQKLREARAARLAFINEEEKIERSSVAVDDAVKAKKKKEDERLAEEKALAEEQARREAQTKKEEAARKAELARQDELAAQAAAEKAAELERQAEQARKQELAKQAEIEKARKAEEERLRQEEQRRQEEEAKAEETRKQQERLEELARQAEEEKQAELARQAEELAELARQEAELAEQAKREAELAELARQEEELAELARQQAELEELERKEKELAELAEKAREEAEAAQREADEAARQQQEEEEQLVATTTADEADKAEEELAKQQAELEELAKQEEELAELERQQAELDALEAEAKALEAENEPQPEPEEEDEETQKQREMDELIQQKYELAELERQQAELDALEAEAKAMLGDDLEPAGAYDDEDEPAIAEDTPVHSDVEE
uniref:Ensconsin-like n=1 Tax=Diabrotica virgifera virgifera TaxID=50390 RepID=A0A6P7FFT9_DIAVI